MRFFIYEETETGKIPYTPFPLSIGEADKLKGQLEFKENWTAKHDNNYIKKVWLIMEELEFKAQINGSWKDK